MNKTLKLNLKMLVFALFLVVIDQISKYAAIIALKGKNDFHIIKDVLLLHYLDGGNRGAAWGMFSGKILMFIIFTLIAIFFICIFSRNVNLLYQKTNNKIFLILNIFLSILLAGAVGNLIDRVVRGYVVDFIYFKPINFPVFNVADCYVTISCIGIVLLCILKINEEDFKETLKIIKWYILDLKGINRLNMCETYYVDSSNKNIRLDKYLTDLLDNNSRNYIQKLIKNGDVLVNEKSSKANYKVQENDCITINIPEPVTANIEPENIPLDIIYEDDDVLIVNKPKDLVVHPAPGHYTGTLVNGIMYHCKDNLSNINGVLRPGIVHRIDKDTTGALIICKNDYSHNFIAEQLKEHTITRKYWGIVQGRFDETEGTIDAPIGRHPTKRKEMAINERNGKHAVTHYKVLKQFDKYALCEFQLETGRTHQIRVHMASINHPLLGDDVYNHNKCPFKLQGQCLHAKTIGFIHPTTKEYVEYEAPIPEYFKNLIENVL